MLIDPDARYVQSHEWAKQDGPLFSIGLSAYAIVQLGKIVYVELPEIGKSLLQGEKFGLIESLKSAVDLCSPLSGKVVAVNIAVADNPDVLKKEVYEKGWLFRLEPDDPAQFDTLMNADAYHAFLESVT